jgi:Fur family transcriptional regulator, ferric uptake regulator
MPETTKLDTWSEALRNSGHRLTQSGLAVLEEILTSDRLLKAEDIVHSVQNRRTGVGRATVYRMLDRLEQLGLIQRVHQHSGCHAYVRVSQDMEPVLICNHCGHVDFVDKTILQQMVQVLALKAAYHVQDYWVQLVGLCATCQNNTR